MPEVKKQVQTVLVNYTCDDCNVGTLKSIGQVLMSMPPLYVHKCNHCGKESKHRNNYPTIMYEEVKQ